MVDFNKHLSRNKPQNQTNTMPEKDPAIITLPAVRLSFPHLWTPQAMEENQEPKFSATFLLDNNTHGALLDRIDALIDRMALDEYKKKINFKRCLRDGNEKSELEGYGDGVSFITASNKARPGVVHRNLSPVTEADGVIYAGCYVNATIRIWIQNNQWGKRANAQLRAVQFLKDGPSFGAGPVDASQEFEALADETVGEEGRARQRGSGRSGTGKASSNLDDY